MTIDVSTEHEIRRLHDVEHWKRGTIVAELGVHPDVVDRVLDRGAERALVSVPRPRLIDPYLPFVEETLKAHPRLRATRLFDMLRSRGYEGSIACVRRHVAEVRPAARTEDFGAPHAEGIICHCSDVCFYGGIPKRWPPGTRVELSA